MATGTYQQAIGSQPVIARNPPPEGTMAAGFTVTLTPDFPNFATALQLNSQSGLMLSQVVTLVLDNSNNGYAITVIHGAFNEVTNVPAGGALIVPTFSNSGSYPLNVAVANGITPVVDLVVDIIFCNYSRQPGSFGNTSNGTVLGSGQNSAAIAGTIVGLNNTGFTAITGVGNWILDSFDMAAEAGSTASGSTITCTATIQLVCGGVNICAINPSVDLIAGEIAGGSMIGTPVARTWPLGLILPRGNAIELFVSIFSNYNELSVRVNLSGWNTP